MTDGRVTGVVVGGHRSPGRTSSSTAPAGPRASSHQLESSGGTVAAGVLRVTIDCAYASALLARSADDFEGSFLVCATSPPRSFRVGAVLPVEDDQWMVMLAGVHGDVPGTTEEEFLRVRPDPAVSSRGPAPRRERGRLSSVASYRFPSSQRRHYEKLAELLPGFVALGDAACSFDPIYGQGMACAALQAAALGETVREVGLRSDELPRRFHRRAARIIDAPWAIAVGADFLHPKTVGPKARGTAPR